MRYSIPAHTASSRLDVRTTNRVLRNTYMLLAMTLLPTIVGAYAGMLFPLIAMVGFLLYFLIFMGVLFGFQTLIIKNRNSVAGIGWLLAFTFLMGYFIGPMIGMALQSFSNGAQLVTMAAGGTAAIFFGVAGYATVTKRDFSQMSFGRTLFIGMWMLFVISLLNIAIGAFFDSGVASAVSLAVSSLFIVIASGFILFTVNRVVRGGEDNYIVATLMLYIMLLNLFQSLLHLLMMFAGNRE